VPIRDIREGKVKFIVFWRFIGAVILLLAASSLAAAPTVDKKKVYFGDAGKFKKPAVILILDVFKSIPEYRLALKKQLDDPCYYLLLEKANKKFRAAVKKAAGDGGYDLVAEKGSVKDSGKTVPDITDKVICALPESVSYDIGVS